MKKILFIIACFIVSITTINAQAIFYCIDVDNVRVTGSSPMYFEFDVFAKAGSPGLMLSDGIIYMDYDPTYFGASVVSSGHLSVDRDDDVALLDMRAFGALYIYNPIITADNTASRFGIVWELSSGLENFAQTSPGNLPDAPVYLCRIRMEIVNPAPDIMSYLPEFYLPLMDRETFHYSTATSSNFPMMVSTPCATLPIELTDFTAEKDEQNAVLKWQTATEINSDHFDIERSTDAEKWESIAKVAAAGHSQTERNYQFADVVPFSGDNYYRLKQVDTDGSYQYSHVEVVKFEERVTSGIAVYPNPANDAIHLEYSFTQEENIQVELFDINGKKHFSQNYNSSESRYQINTSQLVPGTYFLQITTSTEMITRKVIKG